MSVPELLLQTEQFSGWMLALHQAMRRDLPWVSDKTCSLELLCMASTCVLLMAAVALGSNEAGAKAVLLTFLPGRHHRLHQLLELMQP